MNDFRTYSELYHFGILGMHWGIRRYQNKDGSLTEEGKRHKNKKPSKDDVKKFNEAKKKAFDALKVIKTKKGKKDIFKRVREKGLNFKNYDGFLRHIQTHQNANNIFQQNVQNINRINEHQTQLDIQNNFQTMQMINSINDNMHQLNMMTYNTTMHFM